MRRSTTLTTHDTAGTLSTDQRIVDAAMMLFFRYGYSRVVVDDIARELAISKKTIYNHFGGKADILMAGIDRVVQEYMSGSETILNDVDLNFRQKMNAYLLHIGISFSSISRSFLDDLKRAEPLAWQKIADFRRDVPLKNFTQLLDEGARVGYIRDDTTRQLAVLIYVSAVQNLTDPDFLKQFPPTLTTGVADDPRETIEQVVNLLLRSILTDKFYRE
ncbi:TetR/AcrR family transcriptional regulator [Fibrivirga algicola]|uniref:TetR/AcrR family transcriptional regulator n=1 Tax=Fibrivirga algicola TaxID=2950420 RepID=A0ABX0QQS1_9BACT|nr:TetR/AcrR family transcriptional regulator [Fibrivirga algicola]ARK11610.1 TetR family transcriptional regulator [Fibrella sp. ES10-3-2-2]NID12524.1 TetR/AcrR family transcriptional regulator [Fibrivirga algicola]